MRESYAAMVSVIAEIQDADIVKAAGYTRLSMLVADIARVNPRYVSRLISHAEAIAEVMTPTGHVMPARLPVVREAVLAGELDGDQVEAIVRAVKKIPAHGPTGHRRDRGEASGHCGAGGTRRDRGPTRRGAVGAD